MGNKVFLSASGLALLMSVHLSAGTVTFAAAQLDLGSGWRTNSMTKIIDLDGNNILGTDGWFLPDVRNITPTYLTGVVSNPSYYVGNSNYANIDNPITTPGVTPTTIQSLTWNPAGSTVSTLLSFTFAGAIPATVQVSVMVDNVDSPQFNPNSIEVKQLVGGTGDSGAISVTSARYANGNPDWLYFTIAGAKAGDKYSVLSQGTNFATAGAIAFDSTSATPEPSTLAMMGISGLALVFGSLRRKRKA